jgi:fatty acid desaturase
MPYPLSKKRKRMTTRKAWKNYALSGGGAAKAALLSGNGFGDRVEQEWFSCRIDRKQLKRLIKRDDARALRHFGLWLGLLAAAGTVAFLTWGTPWCVVAFAGYGVLYSAADHRHHELSHGTPFKTRWLNDALFHVCAFMTLREGFYYRWSHSRHHTHTVIIGRDPEIAAPRPPDIAGIALDLFFIKDGLRNLGRIVRNATGRLVPDGEHFVPESERGKVAWASRVYVAIILAVAGSCVAAGSILPALFIVLPRFYGGVLSQLFNITQHAGLDEDVYDHRLNTRTVLMNPVFSFLYANMNYHIEHHMFPMVPFYALPELHASIKDQCPPPYPGLPAAYREIIPTLLRQRRDPSYFMVRALPATSHATRAPAAVA